MKQILLYWQGRGVDVTTEWFHFEFEGLTPMVWHLNIEEDARLKLPPEVICGGGSEWNFRRRYWSMDTYGAHWIRFPQAGCLHEQAWGESMTVDVRSLPFEADFAQQFCLKTLPWYFLNRHRARRLVHTADCYRVEFDDSVQTEVLNNGQFSLSEGGRTYVQGSDLCMPALWRPMELIAYSQTGAGSRLVAAGELEGNLSRGGASALAGRRGRDREEGRERAGELASVTRADGVYRAGLIVSKESLAK